MSLGGPNPRQTSELNEHFAIKSVTFAIFTYILTYIFVLFANPRSFMLHHCFLLLDTRFVHGFVADRSLIKWIRFLGLDNASVHANSFLDEETNIRSCLRVVAGATIFGSQHYFCDFKMFITIKNRTS